jgi:hypothetical protein
MTRIERAQIISCLPSTRGVQVIVGGEDDQLDEEDDAGPEDDYPDEEDDFPDDEPEEDEAAPTN